MAYNITTGDVRTTTLIATVDTIADARAYFAARFDFIDMEEDAENPDHYDVAGFRNKSVGIAIYAVEPA